MNMTDEEIIRFLKENCDRCWEASVGCTPEFCAEMSKWRKD